MVRRPVASFASRLQSTTRSERWSLANAVAVFLATAGALWLRSLGPIVGVGVTMLGLLVVAERARWTPDGAFGVANGVTAFRIGLLVLLLPAAAAGPTMLIALSLLILALDGLDGWLARRRSLSSEFGAFLDKETDALFLLPTPQKTESRSSTARYVYGGMVGALLVSFLPYPNLYRPLVAVATAALLVSFGRSLWQSVAPQWALEES